MYRFIVFIGMCILYIIYSLIPNDLIYAVYITVCLLAFLLAFQKLQPKNKAFTGFLFTVGVLIHFLYGNKGLDLFQGITQNLALLAIIILAPLIFYPLEGEGVIESVMSRLRVWQNDRRKSFFGIGGFMMMLAPILNMGAVRVVHGFIGKLTIEPKLLARSYFSGFTPAIVWSPFFASVGIALSFAGMPYITYLPVGLGFAFLMVIASVLLHRPAKSETAATLEDVEEKPDKSNRGFISLIFYVLFLVVLLTSLEFLTKLPMLLLVSINCIVIPLVWTTIRNRWDWVKQEFRHYQDQVASKTNMEISLFLSAGLFGNSLMHTPITSGLGSAISWTSQWSVLLVFLFVVVFVSTMALLGIHQIIAVSIIFPLLLLPEVEISLVVAAFMCIYSWMFSSSLSPLNALNIMISTSVRTNGVRAGIIWNGKYFAATFILAMGYILILNHF